MTTNPLLLNEGIPLYNQITPAHISEATEWLTVHVNKTIDELEALDEAKVSWHTLVEPLSNLVEKISLIQNPLQHLNSVRNTADIRAAYEKALPKFVELQLKVDQSTVVYEMLLKLKNSHEWQSFSGARQRSVEQMIHEQKMSGVGLSGELKEKFNSIQKELSSLSTTFSNNVLDSTKAWEKVLVSRDEVVGLSPNFLEQLSQSYSSRKNLESNPTSGPWLLTLDAPTYLSFLKNSENREIRKEFYEAYLSRASVGEYSNTENFKRILVLRKRQAEILGFSNHVEVSLSSKMADSIDEIRDLQESLRLPAINHAKQEFAEICELASNEGFTEKIEPWDQAFWAQKLEEQKYNFTEEEIKPYFPLDNVLGGLFKLVDTLFGVSVREKKWGFDLWDENVRYFEVFEHSSGKIASFFLDPYSRPENKRGGAWMDAPVNRKKRADGSIQNPVAYLVCNSTPPVGDKPSLMTFREVETLFHEFGHGLQHMLTNVDEFSVAGIFGVEWDAVELPSQFMENWCYHKKTMLSLAKHYETGKVLPDDLFTSIVSAKNFRAGHALLRQFSFAEIDLFLHSEFGVENGNALDEFYRISKHFNYLDPDPNAGKFLNSFSHIFAGGYSAGYYSYLWAKVLSSDAFSAFEEAGLDSDDMTKEVGARFRKTILALGGSEHPKVVFEKFRGRKVAPEAFIRHNGLG